jgi:hypothetical protein
VSMMRPNCPRPRFDVRQRILTAFASFTPV